MKGMRWLLPALSLVAVGVFTWWDVDRVQAGPGPLHSVHATAAGLDGGANCAGCHEHGTVAAPACASCHAAIGEQLRTRRGVHGSLQPEVGRACGICHSEHHGDERPLLPGFAFASAGIPDVDGYRHEHVSFGLEGVHPELACEACHPAARAEVPPPGGRFLGRSQECVACHDDAHDGAFGSGCRACHEQEHGWQPASGLRHLRFGLDGSHAAVACDACHPAATDRSVPQELRGNLAVRACADCHDDPHGRTAIAVAEPADCARCHTTDTFSAARPTAAQHAAFGFALLGRHADASCTSCHGKPAETPVWRGDEAPSEAACADCHEAPHEPALLRATESLGGAVAAGKAGGGGCAVCHQATDATFADGRMTAALHAATGFALTVPHEEVACNGCHVGTPRQQRFPGRLASDCRACHEDPHGQQFTAPAGPRECTSCHGREAWQPHTFGLQEHAAVLPLTGAHDAVACVLCHDQVVDGVRRFVGTPRDCAECHEDVHAGRFDESSRPAVVAGRRGCARCHETSGFQKLRGRFDHALWTGHRLVGAHRELACAACHEQKATGGLGPAPGTRCADCHADVHRGQFDVEEQAKRGTDCRRCHEPVAWRPVTFDHQKHSRFRLDATHGKLACATCHVPRTLADGSAFVRYKPLGRECADCHRLGGSGGAR